MLKMEAWRGYRPVVADSHHLDEEQDPDPYPIEVKSWIWVRICIKMKKWTRIRIKVMRIRNPGIYQCYYEW
jgi:hypothetical protein